MAIRPADHGIVASSSGGAVGMEFIQKIGPMDGTTTAVSFTSIPQKYRHLRIVMANGRRDSSGNRIYVNYNGDTTAGNYGWQVTYNLGGGGVSSTSAGSDFYISPDWPSANNASYCVWDFGNYADSSVGTTCQAQLGVDGRNSGPLACVSQGYQVASAVNRIDLISGSTSSAYYYEAPTTFALFGIGTAA
tara:strand:- start:1528 stop:2097 length:570 start_codon:yes stop_codon:yes gene_type:complete